MIQGINFFGSWETSDGIGRAAKLNLEALEDANINIDKYIISRPLALESGRNTVLNDKLVKSLRFNINLFHFSPRWVEHYFKDINNSNLLRNFYNIGYWFCEVPEIQNKWANQQRYFDEIWTASSFCQTAYSQKLKIPVLKFPLSIEANEKPRNWTNRNKADKFNFLFVLNVYSDVERKNVMFTIKAFLNAHQGINNVCLTIKISNIEFDPNLQRVLEELSLKHKNIKIIQGYVEDKEIKALYQEADVYVSLHRAEGYGLTIGDAMREGIPVITTGYSGNLEFCESMFCRLVAYDLVNIGHERLRYSSDDIWAEPCLNDATSAFIELYQEKDLWREKAERGRTWIQNCYSKKKIGTLFKRRIDLIENNFELNLKDAKKNIKYKVEAKNFYGLP